MDISDFAVASALLTLFVVGATEMVKQAFNKNWKAVSLIAVSALVGGVAGAVFFPVVGLPVGIGMGLSASGLVTTFQKFGEGTVSMKP